MMAGVPAKMEQDTQGSDQPGFSWATLVHPPTTLPAQGSAASAGMAGAPGSGWSPQPPPASQAPPPAWPYAPPGVTGAANAPGSHRGSGSPPPGVSGSYGVAGSPGDGAWSAGAQGAAGSAGAQGAAGSAGAQG